MRRSLDVRASVANLSLRNFGEFTMRNFRDTRTNVARVSHDGRATVLRNILEKKIGLARMSRDCRTNLNENKLHSRESRETLSRMSRDIFSKLDRNSRICRINVYSMRLQRESCVYIVYLCRELFAN